MIHIAKMHTRYPEFKGSGYYNFLFANSKLELNGMIEEYAHDYSLVATKATRYTSIERITTKFPSKEQLNKALFA